MQLPLPYNRPWLLELVDHPSCPSHLREGVQNVLTYLWTQRIPPFQSAPPYVLAAEVLERVLDEIEAEDVGLDILYSTGSPQGGDEGGTNTDLGQGTEIDPDSLIAGRTGTNRDISPASGAGGQEGNTMVNGETNGISEPEKTIAVVATSSSYGASIIAGSGGRERVKVVDFCSGAGGPVGHIERCINHKRKANSLPTTQFLLSDLHPPLKIWRRLYGPPSSTIAPSSNSDKSHITAYPQSVLEERDISYIPDSVDATDTSSTRLLAQSQTQRRRHTLGQNQSLSQSQSQAQSPKSISSLGLRSRSRSTASIRSRATPRGRSDNLRSTSRGDETVGALGGIGRHLRTFFLSFHHFNDSDARGVMVDAMRSAEGIAIFELQSADIGSLLMIVMLGPLSWLITPFTRPSLSTVFFTYIIPLIPLLLMIDGSISCYRTRPISHILHLANLASLSLQLEGEDEGDEGDWQWEFGSVRHTWPFGKMMWIVGRKRRDVDGNGDTTEAGESEYQDEFEVDEGFERHGGEGQDYGESIIV